jgi:hypothetical protein
MMQIEQPHLQPADFTLWWILAALVAVLALAAVFFWFKGRRLPGDHVFRASRFSRGNLLFPTQVAVTPGSVLHFTPEMVGGREQSIHIAHISSVLIDRNLFFSNVVIETSGGSSPVRCHGHRKRDAVAMKQLIERFQSEYYTRPARSRDDGAPREQPPS